MTTANYKDIKVRKHYDVVFPIVNAVILIVLMFVTLYPVINTVAYSLNDGTDALKAGITLWPRVFSTKSYQSILSDPAVYQAAWISASKTVITTMLVLTMYINAGLIPNYLLITKVLHLNKSYWVYIIPTMFSCFNMIVLRTYIAGLPEALVESARIDGAGDIRIFWQIIFPLCKPVLATVALFVAVGSWNSWFDTHLYNGSKTQLHSLQYLLKMKLATTQASSNAAQSSAEALASSASSKTTPVTIRCAITVISTVPILVVYPFLQKYFVTGMVLGSVKG